MTTPRGSYGGGYGSYYPSSASFPDTPIYDSLVAERGTPQIAPIRVPSPYPSYDANNYGSYGGGSNLPALPAALPALPPGPSAQSHYQQPQQAQNGYPQAGYPQQQPTAYLPQQAAAPRPGGYQNGGGYPGQQQSPSGYEAARPVPPRPVPPRQVPGGHPEEQYQRRNLGPGYYQG